MGYLRDIETASLGEPFILSTIQDVFDELDIETKVSRKTVLPMVKSDRAKIKAALINHTGIDIDVGVLATIKTVGDLVDYLKRVGG